MHLIIGKSSQLAQYFPKDYVRISSRNVDFEYLKNNQWESVYITFAEQRIYERNIDYVTPNYQYTMKIIDSLLESSQKIVCYSSCELWNSTSGYITVKTPPSFSPLTNEYTLSKLLLLNKINALREYDHRYDNVIFMHPFYFNSVYRSKYFLFGKIFQSIVHKEKIDVGNLNFYRDMVHAKFVVEKSIEQTEDCMIGSGKLFNVRDFVIDLYSLNNLEFKEFVTERASTLSSKEKLIMAKVDWDYTYQNLLLDTQKDINNYGNVRESDR